jgi:hypothetical protein
MVTKEIMLKGFSDLKRVSKFSNDGKGKLSG